MKHVFRNDSGIRKTVARDAHAPEQVFVLTETDERDVLEKNKKIRSEELMRQGVRNPMVPGDYIAYAFQFPTIVDYNLAQKREPELFAQLHSDSDSERYAAAHKLSILFPGYVTTAKRGDARR